MQPLKNLSDISKESWHLLELTRSINSIFLKNDIMHLSHVNVRRKMFWWQNIKYSEAGVRHFVYFTGVIKKHWKDSVWKQNELKNISQLIYTYWTCNKLAEIFSSKSGFWFFVATSFISIKRVVWFLIKICCLLLSDAKVFIKFKECFV
jgi:hypothetical protein